MRLLLLSLILTLSGCTAMLLGNGNGGGQAAPDARTSAQVEEDAAITSTVRRRFGADSMLKRYELVVQTVDGRVTLHGSVDSYSARARAGKLAAEAGGVASVNNRIRVGSGY